MQALATTFSFRDPDAGSMDSAKECSALEQNWVGMWVQSSDDDCSSIQSRVPRTLQVRCVSFAATAGSCSLSSVAAHGLGSRCRTVLLLPTADGGLALHQQTDNHVCHDSLNVDSLFAEQEGDELFCLR